MKRVLITGMSGTGKSAVIRELIARNCTAYDLDTPEWSHWVEADPSDELTPAHGKDWIWREDRVRTLLSQPINAPLFISGCAANMTRLYPVIDTIILLSAPVATLMERLALRSPGDYGHTVEAREKVAELVATVERSLRASADHEIDTRKPVSATVDEILRMV